jgi:hypothetical protein
METMVFFFLIVYSTSNIIVYGSIFQRFREFVGVYKEPQTFLGKLFGCMMCLPFWVGVFYSITLYSPTYNFFINNMPIQSNISIDLFDYLFIEKYNINIFFTFIDGVIGSGGAWLIHTIQEFFEKD